MTGTGGRLSGDVDIPANSTAVTQTYTVRITATGSGGTTTVPAGEITVDPQVPFDEPPVLSAASVGPRALPRSGGAVTLAVTAADPGGIGEVTATVYLPNGRTQQVALAAAGEGRWSTVFRAPSNPEPEPARYGVELVATDSSAQVSFADGGDFEVAGTPGGTSGTTDTKTAAPTGLQVTPAARWFGVVRAGRRARRTITLRNRGTQAVSGTLAAPRAPFSVVGARRFRLQPGQTRTVAIVYRPRTRGAHRRTAAIRLDGGRRGPTVRLAGRATRPAR